MTDITKDFTHGIAVVNKEGSVLHFCGFMEDLTESDYEALNKELNDDPRFDPAAGYDGIFMIEAPQELMDQIRQSIKDGDFEADQLEIYKGHE